MKNYYKSIFISDIHLGTTACNADALNAFLKESKSDNLFLIGDIIDMTSLKRSWKWPQSHSDVIKKIINRAKNGTNVVYIIGNHDYPLRNWLNHGLEFGNIKFCNEYDYVSVSGDNWLLTHGDLFDSVMLHSWLVSLGDHLYTILLKTNTAVNWFRYKFGLGFWSLSKWAKANTKQALNFILKFEDHLAKYAKDNGYVGVFAGHIHSPVMKELHGIMYMNDGDFCETCSAIVERLDGVFELKILHSNGKMETVTEYNPIYKSIINVKNID
jgi:UDP-2,3-diacylglucosamine pyrophosphatase LpxH